MTTEQTESPGAAPRSASRTRDLLANERTFLAWIRTALGLIGLGFVLARMGLFLHEIAAAVGEGAPDRPGSTGGEFLAAGVVFLVLGTAFAGWSARLYARGRDAIEADRYVPAGMPVAALAAVVVAGGAVLAAMVAWRTLAVGS